MVLMLVLSIRGPSGARIEAPTHQTFVQEILNDPHATDFNAKRGGTARHCL